MIATGCPIAAGPIERCYSMSPTVSVQWETEIVYCGFRAAYRITLAGVFGKTKLRMFCRTDEGDLLDENEAEVSSMFFRGKMLIPFNVAAGTGIYMEIQLPEYGVVCKSTCRPVHNSIPGTVTRVTDDTCEVALEEVRAEVARFEKSSGCLHQNTQGQKRLLPFLVSNLWHSLKSFTLF